MNLKPLFSVWIEKSPVKSHTNKCWLSQIHNDIEMGLPYSLKLLEEEICGMVFMIFLFNVCVWFSHGYMCWCAGLTRTYPINSCWTIFHWHLVVHKLSTPCPSPCLLGLYRISLPELDSWNARQLFFILSLLLYYSSWFFPFPFAWKEPFFLKWLWWIRIGRLGDCSLLNKLAVVDLTFGPIYFFKPMGFLCVLGRSKNFQSVQPHILGPQPASVLLTIYKVAVNALPTYLN